MREVHLQDFYFLRYEFGMGGVAHIEVEFSIGEVKSNQVLVHMELLYLAVLKLSSDYLIFFQIGVEIFCD